MHGSRIITDAAEVLCAARIIAAQHHEKIDASGYLALPGEKIHSFAKIAAIADVFDALISERPYKAPMQIGDVIRYFETHSGILFDAGLVSVLLNHIDEIAGLYRQ
jgi:response regulator RpfG family c-di-GMP phosphodiesterase